MASSTMMQARMSPNASSTNQAQALRNQLMLQQGLAQRMQMQQGLLKQQQLVMQNLLMLAQQQPEENLRKSLRNPNAAVRVAAGQELQRRGISKTTTTTVASAK